MGLFSALFNSLVGPSGAYENESSHSTLCKSQSKIAPFRFPRSIKQERKRYDYRQNAIVKWQVENFMDNYSPPDPAKDENISVMNAGRLDSTPKQGSKKDSVPLSVEIDSKISEWESLDHSLTWKYKMFLRHQTSYWKRRIEKTNTRISILINELYSIFAETIGWRNLPKFSKTEFDIQMEKCFGSLNQTGTGFFTLSDLEIRVSSRRVATMIFSLFLSKKILVSADPLEIQKKHDEFRRRITTPPEPHLRRDEAIELGRRISKILFSKEKRGRWNFRPHDGACLERSKAKGGKRVQALLNFDAGLKEDYSFFGPRRSEVVAQTIFTGGKFRTISVDSLYNCRYDYINTWAADIIRRCRWSIFGREPEDWVFQNHDFLSQDWRISGDLDAATDNLDGRIFEACFREAAIELELSEDEILEVFSFTTRAEFVPNRDFGPFSSTSPHCFTQKRGQLMGSVLSFPFLCIASFIASIWDQEIHKKILLLSEDELTSKKAKSLVFNYSLCGINGDDVILGGNRIRHIAWIDGVKAIGGSPSLGKTLRNREYWTVNSQLFWNGERLPVIRPSEVIRSTKCEHPARSWYDYQKSTITHPDFNSIWRFDKKCKPYLPKSMGGLGEYFSPEHVQEYTENLLRRRRRKKDLVLGFNLFKSCRSKFGRTRRAYVYPDDSRIIQHHAGMDELKWHEVVPEEDISYNDLKEFFWNNDIESILQSYLEEIQMDQSGLVRKKIWTGNDSFEDLALDPKLIRRGDNSDLIIRINPIVDIVEENGAPRAWESLKFRDSFI